MDKLKELKAKKLALLKQRTQYERDNKIEFFGIVDPERHMKGPNPKQAMILEAWGNLLYEIFTFTGANRMGKTTLSIILGFSVMFGVWLWSGEKIHFPHGKPRKVRYIGQDWEKHIKSVVEPALREWWPKNRAVFKKKNNQGIDALWIDEITKSELEIMSNLQDSETHEGWEGDFVIYDEPPKRDIRIANARGLVDRRGREFFGMTLLKEAWVHRDVIKARDEDGKPARNVFNVHGDIWDNVGFGLTKEGVESFGKKLNEEEKDARLHGIPSYMAGLIYPQFKREDNLKKRFKIPLDWIVDIAIDTHPAKKQAVLFRATCPRNYKYLIDEIWEHGDGTYIGEEIIRRVTQNAYRVNQILIDSSAKGDSNNTFTTYEKINNVLYEYGYALQTYKKDEDGGIKQTRVLLEGPNKEPAMFVFDDLVRTIMEIEGYMFDPKTLKPQDKENDMMDNLYALSNEDTQWSAPRKTVSSTSVSNWKVA